MPRNGAYVISDCPDRIAIECLTCKRFGNYSRDRLLERFGDISLPDLRDKITSGKCGMAHDRIWGFPRCAAAFTTRVHPE